MILFWRKQHWSKLRRSVQPLMFRCSLLRKTRSIFILFCVSKKTHFCGRTKSNWSFFSPENENISCWPLKHILISRYRWTPVENSFEIFLSRKKLRSCQRIYHVAVIISVDFWALLIRFHASAHFAFLCQIRVLPHFLSKSQLQP